MKKVNDIFTVLEIIELCEAGSRFKGFCGERCYHCKKTTNVLKTKDGYVCNCGSFNLPSRNDSPPFDNPDYGTPRKTITEGLRTFVEMKLTV